MASNSIAGTDLAKETYGPIVGIFACALAKHVLVAIVLMGVGLDRPRDRR